MHSCTTSTVDGRRAFTAVELLAATMLAVLLMATVLGVLQGIVRSQTAAIGKQPIEKWQKFVASQMEWDLMNSRQFSIQPDGFSLIGFAGREPVTGVPSHRRTKVNYLVRRAGKHSCIIREAVDLDSLSLNNASREIIATGVEGVVIRRSDDNAQGDIQVGVAMELPAQVIVEFYGPARDQPLMRKVVTLW